MFRCHLIETWATSWANPSKLFFSGSIPCNTFYIGIMVANRLSVYISFIYFCMLVKWCCVFWWVVHVGCFMSPLFLKIDWESTSQTYIVSQIVSLWSSHLGEKRAVQVPHRNLCCWAYIRFTILCSCPLVMKFYVGGRGMFRKSNFHSGAIKSTPQWKRVLFENRNGNFQSQWVAGIYRYSYMCIYLHIHTYICIHIYIHIYIYALQYLGYSDCRWSKPM